MPFLTFSRSDAAQGTTGSKHTMYGYFHFQLLIFRQIGPLQRSMLLYFTALLALKLNISVSLSRRQLLNIKFAPKSK